MTFRPPSLIQTPSSTGGDNSRGVDHHDRRLLPQSYRQDTPSSNTTMTGQGSIDVMDGRTTNHSGNRRHRQHNHHHHNQSSHHRHHQLREPDEVVDDRRRPPPTPHESNHAAASSSSNTEHDTSAAPQSQGSLSSRRRSSGLTRLSINSSGSTSGVTTTVAAAAPTPRAAPYRDEMAWLMVTRRRGNNGNANASTNNNQIDDADVVGEEGGTGMHIVVSSPEEDDHELLHSGASHPMTTRHMALTTTIPQEHQRHFVDDDDDEDADGDAPDTADNSADGSNHGGDMGGSGSITDEDLMPVEDPPGSKDEEAEKNFHLSSTSLVSSSSASSPLTPSSVVVIPRGYRLRDEFVCPITREVMVDPVMAADGHTYDRMALERWLLANSTSPKTGQPLEHLHLTPNHNLHRLLNDLFREGGQALWIRESDDLPYTLANANITGVTTENDRNEESSCSDEPQVALILERVLKCKCLGPAESDWMGRTFRVTSQGVSGGRRRFTDASTPSASSAAPQCIQEGGVVMKKEFVQFSDATVSRKHFDITFEKDQTKDDATTSKKPKQSKMVAGKFVLRDLGSAGGTFVRIPPWQPTVLKAGMRIMVGKHQLEVLAPPPRTNQSRSSSRRRTRTSPKACHHGSKGIDNSTNTSTGITVTASSTTRGGHHSRANTGVSVLSLPQVTSVASTVSSNNGGDILGGEEGMLEMDESNLMALREYDHHQQQEEQVDNNGAAAQNPHHRRDSSSVAAAAVAASGCGCASSSSSNTALKHQGGNNISSNPTSGGGGSNTRRNSQDLHQPPSRSNQHPTTKRGSNNNNNTSPLEEITSRTDVNTPKYTSDTAAIAAMMSRFEFCGGSGGGGSGTASASMPSSPMDSAAPSSAVEGATAAVASSLNDQRLQQQPRGMPSDAGDEEDAAVVPQEERTNLGRDINGTHHGRLRRGKTTKTTPIGASSVEIGCECGEGETNENDEERITDEGEGSEEENDDDEPLLILRCYAPEGTPIQGREYPVGRKGATLGRKAQNTISFSHTVKQVISVPASTPATADGPQQEEREQVVENVVGIDSSISGEHATILYNPKTQQLELQDGACPPSSRLDDNNGNRSRRFNKNSSAVGSTNGTWVRLSGMHEESQPFTLEDNSTEILIGTVRFLVTLEDAIVERDYYSHHSK